MVGRKGGEQGDPLGKFCYDVEKRWGFPSGASGKEPTCQCGKQGMRVWSLGWEYPLEEVMATHSSVLDRRIPWTGEPDGSIGSQRVEHD